MQRGNSRVQPSKATRGVGCISFCKEYLPPKMQPPPGNTRPNIKHPPGVSHSDHTAPSISAHICVASAVCNNIVNQSQLPIRGDHPGLIQTILPVGIIDVASHRTLAERTTSGASACVFAYKIDTRRLGASWESSWYRLHTPRGSRKRRELRCT